MTGIHLSQSGMHACIVTLNVGLKSSDITTLYNVLSLVTQRQMSGMGISCIVSQLTPYQQIVALFSFFNLVWQIIICGINYLVLH